jgi:hypothetical protein
MRRTLGWLLLVAAPGLLAGIVLTLMAFVPSGVSRIPFLLSLVLWGVAAVASAFGGSLLLRAGAGASLRFLVGIAGFLFGAGAYLVAMIAADFATPRF